MGVVVQKGPMQYKRDNGTICYIKFQLSDLKKGDIWESMQLKLQANSIDDLHKIGNNCKRFWNKITSIYEFYINILFTFS